MSSDQTRFGVPKAFTSRRTKGAESPIAVVEGEDWLKATLDGPCAAASRRIAAAVVSRASSHEISTQPGFASPFGRVRRKGRVSRSLL
jgi:hypothetical protein